MKKQFLMGMRHGMPICLGYLSVSFGFGIFAVEKGLSALAATLISVFNLTSAGQTAGVLAISQGGKVFEIVLQIVLTQLVINVRYSLMAISLSQKLDSSFTTPHRLLAAYGITDEIFAVSYAQPRKITPWYMYGMILVSLLGWGTGTFLGAAAGELLPEVVAGAMGILLYGMFVAIVVPPARKDSRILFVVGIAATLSVIMYYLMPFVPAGISIILCAVLAAAIGAALFPEKEAAE